MSKTYREGVIHGRGALSQPTNRFESLSIELSEEEEAWRALGDEEVSTSRPRTEFLKDTSRTILSSNDSPDLGFSYSVNPYRGCEHGCTYCYARPTHEYIGFSSGLDFERKIMVKEDAPELLRSALSKKSWQPQTIFMSGVTDCYQPVERRLKLTRRCLEVLAEFRNPVVIVTKNALVTRDKDVLQELAQVRAVMVFLTVTTLDTDLCNVLEPRTSRPAARIEAIRELSAAGIPAGVMVAPVIPGLTDHEISSILRTASEAGAVDAGMTLLRLPYAVAPMFEQWLEAHVPGRKERVLNLIRDVRRGGLNDPEFGSRMRGTGPVAESLSQLFHISYKKYGFHRSSTELSAESFRQAGPQMDFFHM